MSFFFFNVPATTEIYTLSLHDALPISIISGRLAQLSPPARELAALAAVVGREFSFDILTQASQSRSEEHTSELQSQFHLVCCLLLEKKKSRFLHHHSSASGQCVCL